MSRLHDIKTNKKKKHSCSLSKQDEVLNQKSNRNQPHKRIW